MRAAGKPVVTISSTYGAGGTVVGPAVAQHLGLPYLGRAVPAEVASAAAGDVPGAEGALSDEEQSDGMLRRVLESLASVPALFGSVVPPLDDTRAGDDVRERVEASIVQMADETGGVIVGRGATFVLRAHRNALHVRLDGPRDRRIAQAMRIEGIDEAEARRRQAAIDRTRARYVKRFYDVDSGDAARYHLVLDSTVVPLDTCADVIARAARAHFAARP